MVESPDQKNEKPDGAHMGEIGLTMKKQTASSMGAGSPACRSAAGKFNYVDLDKIYLRNYEETNKKRLILLDRSLTMHNLRHAVLERPSTKQLPPAL